MKKIMVLHGPNLDRLGLREPALYGTETLALLNVRLQAKAKSLGFSLAAFQENAEGDCIARIHQCADEGFSGLVINPAAYTHTSIAIRDALLGLACPFVEVHISNIFARETFRHHSYCSDLALGTITGLGGDGYLYALDALASHIARQS